jgi:hypothetical protein
MAERHKLTVGRRDFLHVLGAGAAVAFIGGPLAGKAGADSEKNDEKRKARYRQTEHVKTFFRVNRYPN